jgi:hypothetical protein
MKKYFPLFFKRDIQNLLRQFVLNFLICCVEKYFLKVIVSQNNLFQNQEDQKSKRHQESGSSCKGCLLLKKFTKNYSIL